MNMPRSKGTIIGFWIATALFCLQIGFTAYAQLRLPQVAEAFTHLGFPDYFRPERWSWAVGTGVLWSLSYFFWRRAQAAPVSANVGNAANP